MKVLSIFFAVIFAWPSASIADSLYSGDGHSIIGKWSYTYRGKQYVREFYVGKADSLCALTLPSGKVAWRYRFEVRDSKTVDVYSTKTGKYLRHKLLPDGRLDIEGKYIANRVVEASVSPHTIPSRFSTRPPQALSLVCDFKGGQCWAKSKNSSTANCYPPKSIHRDNWLVPNNCENAGGTWTRDRRGKTVCAGMANPC